MPPCSKVTKEKIISVATELVRYGGESALNARAIAAAIGCSTQPVFSNFSSMDELKLAVVGRAEAISREYVAKETECGKYPAYKAEGMAYIRFAKEENELFKLLYMRDRSGEAVAANEFTGEIKEKVKDATGLDNTTAGLFHLEMWAFVHGIAAMFATGFLDLEWELVSKMITDCYMGLRKQYGME